jgi:hypothetical protein
MRGHNTPNEEPPVVALHRCPKVLPGTRTPQVRCGRPVQVEECGEITSTEGRVVFVRTLCAAGHHMHGPRELFAVTMREVA